MSKFELFVQHLFSVFSQADIAVPHLDFECSNSFSHLEISASNAQNKLEALDPNKSADPDIMATMVLKFCAAVHAGGAFGHPI